MDQRQNHLISTTAPPVVSPEQFLVVLMLGGSGNRLRPLTDHCPKPLLKIGGKPIVQWTLELLIQQGFKNFVFSVHYKAEMFEKFFGNGSGFGARITYLREPQRLGTAGPLRLLPRPMNKTLVVINGDLITELPMSQLLIYHQRHDAHATMAITPYEIDIPFGVVETDGVMLKNIHEKPTHVSYINAGIYILQPKVLEVIPEQGAYDMPALFSELARLQFRTCAFPLREEWIDIGSIETYEKVCERFKTVDHSLDSERGNIAIFPQVVPHSI